MSMHLALKNEKQWPQAPNKEVRNFSSFIFGYFHILTIENESSLGTVISEKGLQLVSGVDAMISNIDLAKTLEQNKNAWLST
jgi:hypothetical protein